MSDAPSEPGLRERKKRLVRQAILETAERLFAARGYDLVTVADIADAADVSVKTLFSYFRSKEDLVFQDTQLIDMIILAIRTRSRLLTPALAVAEKLVALLGEAADGEGLAAYQRGYGDGPAVQARLLRLWLEYEDLIAAELAREAGLAAATADLRFQAGQIALLIRSCTWREVNSLAQNGQRPALEKWLKMTAWRLE
jgi:AcrR family transcriptional regulator